MGNYATNQYLWSSNGQVQCWQKPVQRRRKKRKQQQFAPTTRQIIAAKQMICEVLRRGKLYAANVRDAAYRLRKKLGEKSRKLGHTPRQSQATLERGLMELLGAEKVMADQYGYALTA